MNDYIINPSFFYWANVVDTLIAVMIIVSIAGIVASVLWIVSLYEDDAKPRKAIVTLVISLLIGVAAVFIPSKEAMIEIEIARHATTSNVKELKEELKDATDYVFDKIEKMQK